MTIETTGTACYGPPPLPPNKRPASAAIPRHHHTTSTYLSFQDPLDEILVISSEDLPPIDDKSKSANGQQHRRKNSFKKCKHSQTLSLPKYSDVDIKEKSESKFGANRLISGFQRSLSARTAKGERSTCATDAFDYGIPLKTFSETFSKKCEDLTACEDVFRQPFATIRSSRPSSLTRSHLNTGSLSRRFGGGEARFSLARSSSEGNLRAALEAPAPPGRLGKCLRALSGSWKNLFLLGGMSRSAKPAAKRVPPPAVPDAFGAHRHSGSSFGSQGYASSEDATYPQPPDTPSQPRDDHSDYGSTVSTVSGKSPGACPAGAFAFPAPLTHKAAVLYHHQLALQEDQGIDMTQSPGRDSPGSSSGSAGSGSRHSCASLDSGRASGRGAPPGAAAHHAGCLCAEHADRVRAMMAQGVPDHEIIHAWLADLHLDEYAPLFAAAGYDLATMTRMTPEDLTAIGIKKPNHRKRLKAEIANLNVQDNLPDYIPGSLEEWLRLLRLEEYGPALVSQGYRSVHDVTQLAWEDLEDTGIVRLGHQKKILLAIKRVKDIRAGKRSISNQGSLDLTRHQQHIHGQDMLLASGDLNAAHVHLSHHAYQQQWEIQQTRNISASYHAQMSHQKIPNLHFDAITTSHGTDMVPIQIRHPRGKSLESLEDTSERTHLTFSPEAQTFYYTNPNTGQSPWRRSYDDGDITPTNEATILSNYEGGGTLPRPRGLVRPRPVAKISATAKPVRENVIFQDVNEKSAKYIMDFQGGTYTDKLGYPMQPQHLTQMRPVYAVSPHMGKKLPPEPPKRQSSNPGIDQMTQQMEHMAMSNQYMQGYPPLSYQYAGPNYGQTHQTTVEIHMEKQKSLPLSLPAYPSSDSLSVSLESAGLLPPPPAPSSPPRWASNSGSVTPASLALEEQEIANKLVLQSRNGSDASFKSSSSAESDSIPFANENAGTIKQNRSQMGGRPHTIDYSRGGIALATLPPRHPQTPGANIPHPLSEHTSKETEGKSTEPADVLNDIGNMLANLTDELDAMLEEEKRQGLTEA